MKRIPYQTLCMVHRRWREGETLAALAAELGMRETNLPYSFDRAGLNRGPWYLDPFPAYAVPESRTPRYLHGRRRARILSALRAGMGQSEVARQEGVGRAWVCEIAHAAGIPGRRGRPRKEAA